jgi:hypothetical protein
MTERETRSNCEKYYELRRRAHKICTKKKKEYKETNRRNKSGKCTQ